MSWSDVLRVLTAAGIRASDLTMSTPEATALAEALERARVVAVLDGWAEKHGARYQLLSLGAIGCRVSLVKRGATPLHLDGPTPDAARAAAARAIEAGEV